MRAFNKQKGFTLLELMVAMSIFAMLALTGWQIMDSLTKSRDRSKVQIKAMSDLQFAYLQLSQDLSQTSNYVAVPMGIRQDIANHSPKAMPTFTLNSQGIVFKRFAMPDPRYELSPIISQVGYHVVDDKLIKSQWDTVQPTERQDNAKTSVLLVGMSQAKWTAFTPSAVTEFPDMVTIQKASVAKTLSNVPNNLVTNNFSSQTNTNNNANNSTFDLTPYQQLPKGIQLEFVYQDEPIVWRFALPNQAPNTVSNVANPVTSGVANTASTRGDSR